MIRFSRMTDYGLVLLTRMAAEPAGIHNARALADTTGLPLPTVSKILKALAKEGLLTSTRGVSGGYALARAPESITLAQCVAALEGPVALTVCSEGPDLCGLEAGCRIKSNLQVVNRAFLQTLTSIRLSEFTRPLPRGPTPPGAGRGLVGPAAAASAGLSGSAGGAGDARALPVWHGGE